jgi:orotate phosphoribosyltransferase-like protein
MVLEVISIDYKNIFREKIFKNEERVVVWKLFEPEYETRKLLDVLIDGIFYTAKMRLGDIDRLVGIERSGVPIVALMAYFYKKNFSILRTIPKLAERPTICKGEKIALIDDASYTGRTFYRAMNLVNRKKTKNIALSVLKIANNSRGIKNDREIKIESFFEYRTSEEKLEQIGEAVDKSSRIDRLGKGKNLKKVILTSCLSLEKQFWTTWGLFTSDIFPQVCKEFLQKSKEIEGEFGIIANSVYGLPFATILSYKLKKPLYLFSRFPYKLEIDFEPELKSMNDFIMIDDVVDTGTMMEYSGERLHEHGKNILKRFVVLNMQSDRKNTSDIFSIVTDKDIEAWPNII